MIGIIKKEILEGIKTYKFIIIAAGVIFFAILDPLMLKLLPNILELQMPDVDITQIIQINQFSAVANYYKNLHQLGVLIVSFTLMGLLAGEINTKRVIIPWCNGMRFNKLIIGKSIVYFTFLVTTVVISTVINNFYARSIFDGQRVSFLASVKAGIMFGLFYCFMTALMIYFGSIIKKPSLCALVTILIAYLISPITRILNVTKYTPAGLLSEANDLTSVISVSGVTSVIVTMLFIIILVWQTLFRLKRYDLS